MRKRLDVLLAERGLAPSREKAQALVMSGRVRVAGQPARKPGTTVPEETNVEVLPGQLHVGRGALKLAGALDLFAVDPTGATAVDIGASTGGFTEVLLARGALRVHAVDVGRGQIHESLRADSRVILHERTNARRLTLEILGECCDLAVMDVSFISVRLILPALLSVLAPGAHGIVLVKPQFEVGRHEVGRGGLVKDPSLHRWVVEDVARWATGLGYGVVGVCASPITGADGNREFFLHLRAHAAGLDEGAIVQAITESVTATSTGSTDARPAPLSKEDR